MPYFNPGGSGGGSGEIPTLAQVVAQGNEVTEQTIIFEGPYHPSLPGYTLRLESGPQGIVTKLILPDGGGEYLSSLAPTGLNFKAPGQSLGNSFSIPFDVTDGAVWSLPRANGPLALEPRKWYTEATTQDPLDPGASLDLFVPLGTTFRLFAIRSQLNARLRIYVNETARTNDAARLFETPPTPGAGCLLDIQIQQDFWTDVSLAGQPYFLAPALDAWNFRYGDPEVAISITNTGAEAGPVKLGFHFIRTDVSETYITV